MPAFRTMRNMHNPRSYGQPPFDVAVIHGGPGAGGEMAPVARALAPRWGVLEPIQTTSSLEGQVQELRSILRSHGDLPVTLIGFSWGAWLSFIVAARYPSLVQKLILIGSGPFEEQYVAQLRQTRLGRLDRQERTEFESIVEALSDPTTEDKDTLLARLGALASKTDAYDPIATSEESGPAGDRARPQGDMFQRVWNDAAEMRRTGALLALGKQVQCPVCAIHGDHDPHPAAGVHLPLANVLSRFRFILLERCGHMPWIERQAQDAFYAAVEKELIN
jgi:pimeloyl-ACP methyl ester carboxylesterase